MLSQPVEHALRFAEEEAEKARLCARTALTAAENAFQAVNRLREQLRAGQNGEIDPKEGDSPLKAALLVLMEALEGREST